MDDHEKSRKKRKKPSKEALKELENEEERLMASIFHDGGSFFSKSLPTTDDDPHRQQDLYSFSIDRAGDYKLQDDSSVDDKEEDHESVKPPENSKIEVDHRPAWVDEDDDHLQVNLVQGSNRIRKLRKAIDETIVSSSVYEERLRERFQTTTEAAVRADWARLDADDVDDDSDKEHSAMDKIVSAGPLLATKRKLASKILDIKRCPDLNLDEPNRAVVQSVHFHQGSDPSAPIALTAGLDKTLRLFRVTEDKSEKIHGIHCMCSVYLPSL